MNEPAIAASESWERTGESGPDQILIRRRVDSSGQLTVMVFTAGRRYRASFTADDGRRFENSLVELLGFDTPANPVRARCLLLSGFARNMHLDVALADLADAER